jgi:hypothetical protein
VKGAPPWLAAALPLVLGLAVALAACGGKTVKVPVGATDATAAAPRKPNLASQSVVGHLLGAIGERTLGPFMARSPDAQVGMVGWITAAEGTSRRVMAIPITGVGEPRGGARSIASVGIDATSLVVRPTRGKTPGFALAWTVLTDRGEALWSVVLNDDGVPRDKPIELARTTDDVVWVDIVPTDAGAVCIWAEETRGGDANVLAAGLDVDGKVRGVPARIARGVTGWHALEIVGGVGVSTMTSAAAPASKVEPRAADSRGGTLAFQRLDGEGRPLAAPIPIVSKATVSGHVEVVRASGRLLFAWTDRTTEEPTVAVAALADDGTVEPARKIVEARGGAALIGLASGAAGTAFLYEAPSRRNAGDARHVHAGVLAQNLTIDGRPVPVEVMGRATPELVATEGGFAILAPQRDCETGSPRCLDAAVLPTVVRTDARLTAVQRESFGFGTDPASMAWGMTCGHDICVVLAASGAAPARVRAAEVRSRANLQAPTVAVAAAHDGPRVTDVTAVATGENIIDLAVAHIGDVTVLATLSMKPHLPGARVKVGLEDARNAPLVLSTRVIDASGAVSKPVIVTNRALAVGGVAIAPAEKAEDGAAVAWVGRDNGDPEVHVTKIDKKGRKTNEVQLTTVKGDASDVAIAWASGAWIVGWIDGRDGNGEVYASRVGADLSRNAGERITTAPGDASDLVALAVGDLVWLAWADPRESPQDGVADIFVGAVRTKDAKPVVPEQRLLATAAHSRTPQLAPASDGRQEGGVNVAWIEEAPLGVQSPASSGYGAMWVTVDANGKPMQRPTKLPSSGEGAATSVALDRHAKGLHAVVARSMVGAIALDVMELSVPEPRPFPLLTLDGPPSLDVALVIDGDTLYFNDDGPTLADKRARRARIAWLP